MAAVASCYGYVGRPSGRGMASEISLYISPKAFFATVFPLFVMALFVRIRVRSGRSLLSAFGWKKLFDMIFSPFALVNICPADGI